MIDALITLVPEYELLLLAVVTFLSCLALPVPSSVMLLSAGGFVAAGELTLWETVLAAFTGAVLGDQLGYRLGQHGARILAGKFNPSPKQTRLLSRASQYLSDRGALAVFFSRWLVSPLGPYVNFAAGATELDWKRFTMGSVTGEAVWVSLYIGLGAFFAHNLETVASVLGDVSGLLAAFVVLVGLVIWLRAGLRHRT